jgi:hypothetical protein
LAVLEAVAFATGLLVRRTAIVGTCIAIVVIALRSEFHRGVSEDEVTTGKGHEVE